MPSHLRSPLVPRNGHALVVGIVARISGCQNQKELSLDDQIDHAKQVVAELFDGPVEYRIIATKGKGERLDRPELEDIQALLRSGVLDLLVAEDIGRMVRGGEALRLCGIAVDHGTRVLAPNDCIDTADDSWEEDVLSACRDHVGHNAHTSKRLKQKLMNRFVKLGGVTPGVIFGYIKPAGAKTYDDWHKDSAATPIFREWFRRLRETLNCSAVADWLNEQGVSVGKHCRRTRWDGKMVRRYTRNPLLKGMPGRGFHHTIKHNETGRRISVKNPDGPKYREYPHLAHVPADEFDHVNAQLAAKNQRVGRKPVNGSDPRWRVARKRTRFPGQYARCWYCGRHYVWGANGMTDNLMCSGAREWACWNSVGCTGALAAQKIVEATSAELYNLQGFDEQFREITRQAAREGGAGLDVRWTTNTRETQRVAREKENLLAAIAALGPKPMLLQKVTELEAAERNLARERRELEALQSRALQLPESVSVLRRMLEEHFQKLTVGSPEFGELMCQLVPDFHVYLVRLCDGGHPLPRARITLALGEIFPDTKHVPGLKTLLMRELTLDLFVPPQRERIRPEAVHLASLGLQQRAIAQRLPEKATPTAVQRALALDRMMREQDRVSPYVFVAEPPPDYPKLRRHNNGKYTFRPLERYPRPIP